MANAAFVRGGTIAVTTSVSVITVPTDDRVHTVLNQGAARVYLTVNSLTTTTDEVQLEDKFFLDQGQSMRLPDGITSFAIQCAAGTATVLMVRTFA